MNAFFLFSRWRSWWAPALLMAAGLFLRAACYQEHYAHPDEIITVGVVKHMRLSGDWDTNWAKADVGPGYRYDQYNFSSHLYATYFFYRAVKLIPGLEAWRSYDDGFRVYRFFSVLLASAAVAQTWWLARRVGGDAAGLGAGALAAVAPLLVQDGHYMRPEAFVTVLTLAVATLSLPAARVSFAKIFGAAVLVGLLVACKVSMLALGWLPLVPAVAAPFAGGTAAGVGRLGWAAAATLGGVALGFFLGAPGAVLHPEAFRHGVDFLTKQYAGLHPPYCHVDGGPVWDLLGGYFRATLGWPALVAGAVGAVLLATRRRGWELVVVAGPVAIFAGYFSTRTIFFERNLSHVLPLFCVLAGVGMAAAAGALAARVRWPVLGLTLAFGAVVVARPAELTRRLVWEEFSGRGLERHTAFEAEVRGRHPGVALWVEAMMNEEPLDRLRVHFKGGGAPVLVRVVDYHDEWSARYGPSLPAKFDAELVGHFVSGFADVPGCTLHTYNSWTDRYYLVRGPKPR